MEGETISEMVEWSGELPRTIERRIQRAKIQPISKEATYPVGTFKKIKDVKKGRPSKPEPAKTKPKSKKVKK